MQMTLNSIEDQSAQLKFTLNEKKCNSPYSLAPKVA
jgi:hypothetical protein